MSEYLGNRLKASGQASRHLHCDRLPAERGEQDSRPKQM